MEEKKDQPTVWDLVHDKISDNFIALFGKHKPTTIANLYDFEGWRLRRFAKKVQPPNAASIVLMKNYFGVPYSFFFDGTKEVLKDFDFPGSDSSQMPTEEYVSFLEQKVKALEGIIESQKQEIQDS